MSNSRSTHRRRQAAIAALIVLGAGALAVTTYAVARTFLVRSLRAAPGAQATATAPVVVESASRPGSGVLTGRLVDGVTGLPVADAGVTLLDANRRALSGPDGRFRFDGVDPGAVTIAFGPVEGYVPRTLAARQETDGLDIGITPLLPVSAPTYVMPEYGGLVPGCGETRLLFASMALTEPSVVSVTCVERPDEFPAAAPAGRLPLAVVDTAPGVLRTRAPAQLVVQLPSQPRYNPGVALDLLRLDPDRLVWRPAGQVTVDPGGRTASGPVAALGTYLVAAPPFGQFAALEGDASGVNQVAVSDRANGAPVDVFGPDTPIVYVGFDFAGMENTTIAVRTLDARNRVVHESARPYTGSGRDNAPMVAPDGRRWPVGTYVTTLYRGDPPEAVGGEVPWRVAAQPAFPPAPPTLPPSPPIIVGPWVPVPPPGMLGACVPPSSWWARTIIPGDTLSGLAARTGASVAQLMGANCLTSTDLYVGQVIYVPRPPKAPPRWPVGPPAAPPVKPTWPTTTWPTPSWPMPTAAMPTLVMPLPTMPPPWPTNGAGPALPTPWKATPEPGGWTPPPAPPTAPPPPVEGRRVPPGPPPAPTYAPAPTALPPPAAPPPTPVAKWTPGNRGEPTLAPRPTVGP